MRFSAHKRIRFAQLGKLKELNTPCNYSNETE